MVLRMIKVHLINGYNDQIMAYSVIGHTDNTAVCAAVSGITQTVILGLQEYLNYQIQIKSASGYLKVALVTHPDKYTETLIRSMVLGLKELMKIHPGTIEFV